MTLDNWTWRKKWDLGDDPVTLPGQEVSEVFEDTTARLNVNVDQIKNAAKYDLNVFAGLIIPEVFTYPFPPWYQVTWELLIKHTENDTIEKFPKFALGIPRGFAKTTLMKLYVVWCILYTKRLYILIISDVADKANNILSDIADMLDGSNVKLIWGNWRLAIETDRADLKIFPFLGRVVVLDAMGAGGSVRGKNINNERPSIMLFDDIQTREVADSRQQSHILETWFLGTALKAASPKGCVYICAGNFYPTPHSLLKKLRDNPHWIKFIAGAILADGTSLWPEHKPMPELIKELDNDIRSGHPEIFFAEVLNDTEVGINTRVDLSMIKPWPWPEDQQPDGKFIIIDPSANKQGGDEVTIGYCEMHDTIGGLRELFEGNISPSETIKRALIWALEKRVRVIAVEATAYQYSLLHWFEVASKQANITGISFVPLYTGNYSKNARITDMLKSVTKGDIAIHGTVKSAVMNQIVNFSALKRNNTDGILDLLTYIPQVIEKYGGMILTDFAADAVEAEEAEVEEFNSPF